MRELGFKAELARMKGPSLRKFAKLWASPEEVDALEGDLSDHFCSPAELGWGYTINLEKRDFYGRDALVRERKAGGPARKLAGLTWYSDDITALYAGLFRDGPSAPPPDLPTGQFRMFYLMVLHRISGAPL